jgi:hypothetical protein
MLSVSGLYEYRIDDRMIMERGAVGGMIIAREN